MKLLTPFRRFHWTALALCLLAAAQTAHAQPGPRSPQARGRRSSIRQSAIPNPRAKTQTLAPPVNPQSAIRNPQSSSAISAIPALRTQGTATQLVVDGQPLVLLAGELHNSSSSSLDYMNDKVWPVLDKLNMNSVIASISWELVEPEEGKYDFALVDGIIEGARAHNKRLVFIWFATWKNGDGTYIPAWVKTNPERFPRCQHVAGRPTTQLCALAEENLKADARAFAAVMKHIREVDSRNHTVVTMQIENEAGVKPVARDHHPLAEAAFAQAVPAELMQYLAKHKEELLSSTREIWGRSNNRESGTWSEIFGQDADEVFSAWTIGGYIGKVAAAGKAEYPIPMYANAWLVQSPGQKAGQYPSGGPVAKMMDVWRAAAPAIDFLAPDIYLDDFKAICDEYNVAGNPLFIPEARTDPDAGRRACYAIGERHAICFAPFGIDSIEQERENQKKGAAELRDTYAMLGQLMPLITAHQGKPTMRGFMQYGEEKQHTFEIGDFKAEIDHNNRDAKARGAGLVIAITPDTFVMAGSNYNIRFGGGRAKPGSTGWLSIEEGVFKDGQWVPGRRLNGDEASYKVNLGPTPRILIGRAYRF